MAKKTLGRIFPVPEGTYSSSKTYKELSIVTYNGNSYICKKQSSGNDPTNTTYWQLIASKGERGEQGVPGASGTSGGSGLSSEQLAKLNNSIAVEDRAINNCNEWLSNGYIKTSTSTTNLPAKCTGNDKYGILFFIAENIENHTGTQMYYPIDGTYRGRIFTRAIANGTPSEWNLISNFDGDYNSLTNKPVSGAKTYDKYVVFCVAGQSNAVGYDESVVDDKFIYKNRDNDRIKQLGFYGEDNLKLVNLGYCAQSMQDMRVNNRVGQQYCGTKGIHLPLANLMLDYIPDDYGILVLPIAYGGTGFTSGNNGTYSSSLKKPTEADPKASSGGQGTAILRWGTDTAYYQTLRDRIIHALKLNDDNLFAGIVWCQGENDKTNASGHKSGFEAMTAKLFEELNAYESGALKARVPKKVWDKDIWYNMETVSYWYSQGQCQTIWNNYKSWNEKTYVEIPRKTESNTRETGTGDTTKTYESHYGQNAYQRVIAPRVLQKMIDMNTFAKRVNVVEPECKTSESSGGSSSYPVATEGTRTLVQSDITKTSTINFTVDGSGNCTASETLSGKFKTGTNQPCVSFGDIFKMEWEAKRGQYWMVIEGDITDGFLVLGIGGNMTCQLAKIQGGRLEIVDNANGYGSRHYTIRTGDKIRVYRNSDKTISIYRTNNADGIFQKWFDYENKNVFEKKSFGFALGIGGNEFNGDFSGSQELVFNGMKIQKQELFPNNKLLDLQLDEMVRALKA
jgi:putative transposase